MPELPEVETIARELRRTVVGKRIEGVSLSGLPLRRPIPGSFASGIRGRTIERILRRGKYLVAVLQPKSFWIIHFGMSGRLLLHPNGCRATGHTHAAFRLSDGSVLEYRDPRRFGLLAVYDVTRPGEIPEIRSLGVDPLSAGFGGARLQPMLARSGQDVKSFLLDQSCVAGLGNIYACESLHLARIHPRRRCRTLTREEALALADAIRRVLGRAVRSGGTSFSDFVDLRGHPGDNQRHLRVFQREGDACMRCGHTILRVRQAGRSTFFCASCQK